MSTDNRPAPGPDATADELQADIEQTRADLGETVDALTQKLDVKARAKGKASEIRQGAGDVAARAKDSVTDDTGKPTPIASAGSAVAAAAVVLLVFVFWRRRR